MNPHSTHVAHTELGAIPAPNHHATHPGFSGARGLVAAVTFLFGRGHAAQLAMQLSGLRPGDRLVDVGCGPGFAVQRARTYGAEVVGVDPAPVMLGVARARWRRDPGIEWRTGTAESLPVADGWANVVWSIATVHHWADVDAALAEARRVLAPGGRLVALERRIHDVNAGGTASHGWTVEQSESFAEHCRQRGFTNVSVGTQPGRMTVLSVVADAPEPQRDE